ncbi:hypothetical protein BACCIP111883_04204 [Sutcliffiella rhizosphaerae]|uniref:Uncharacterized protein n=1 Tax=Sutcliffiella rhizosphaerae TaxID=2880967 RepID=A0ABN8AJR0_9BACI|nr:hypothetical protein BACCIP111883_04204 [Sutcliffiella rhizosphaerae]
MPIIEQLQTKDYQVLLQEHFDKTGKALKSVRRHANTKFMPTMEIKASINVKCVRDCLVRRTTILKRPSSVPSLFKNSRENQRTKRF